MVVRYANYDGNGKITSTGICSAKRFRLKQLRGERVIAGAADDRLHAVVGGKIVNRVTPESIIAVTENPEPLVRITVKQWQDVLNRISVLEKT